MSSTTAVVNSNSKQPKQKRKVGPSHGFSASRRRLPQFAVCFLRFCSDFHITNIRAAQRLHELSRFSMVTLDRLLQSREEPIAIGERKIRGIEPGWYGCGSLFSASIPNTAANEAHNIVHSNVIGMTAGHC